MKRESITGELGESIACRYLQERGYEVIERNYRKSWGEIDIIAKKGSVTHFLEVKTISKASAVQGFSPADNLHPRKFSRITKALESFLLEHEVGDWQIDAILIVLDETSKKAQIKLIPNIGW